MAENEHVCACIGGAAGIVFVRSGGFVRSGPARQSLHGAPFHLSDGFMTLQVSNQQNIFPRWRSFISLHRFIRPDVRGAHPLKQSHPHIIIIVYIWYTLCQRVCLRRILQFHLLRLPCRSSPTLFTSV